MQFVNTSQEAREKAIHEKAMCEAHDQKLKSHMLACHFMSTLRERLSREVPVKHSV